MTISLAQDKLINLLKVNEEFSQIKDIDSLLDRILSEARNFTNADAGSIYLVKGNKLTFDYVQNNTLKKKDKTSRRFVYFKQEMEINHSSIAGHVVLTKKSLLIADVYKIKGSVPYSFNQTFDKQSSYRTKSTLTVPLITSREKVIGVMQIINSKDSKGTIIPFSKGHKLFVTYFASHAAVAIEKALMTREIILRMIKMAELRDPKETAAHVNRVGAFSIEIYHSWARKNGESEKKIKKIKDLLRIAAMLHDVGKIGVSDIILRKKQELTKREFNEMKMHTIYGARLFQNSTSDWDDMAAEIILNHHERWDGKGYPGHINNLFKKNLTIGQGKKGEEIPITGRIVALADIYDALSSKRIYKKSWSEDDILEYLNSQRMVRLDPDVVDVFFSIHEVIKAIQSKFKN